MCIQCRARRVDRVEAGMHCYLSGHRICWECQVGLVDWVKVVSGAGTPAQRCEPCA
jgi:hypothetical protein